MLNSRYEFKQLKDKKNPYTIDKEFELFKNNTPILPFDEARKKFKNKVDLTDKEYRELVNEAKAKAFSFAGAKSLNITKQVHKSLLDEVATSSGEKAWQKKVGEPLFAKLGIEPKDKGHLSNIYRTNLFTAYSQAKWDNIQANKKVFKYLMYDAVGDNRTRPTHKAMDGLVFAVDDPFWNTHYPPNGYNCYSDDTEVFTNNGWKLFKDVDINKDLFLSINPETKELDYIRAVKKIEQYRDEKLLHFKNGSLDCLVTKDHNMLIMTNWNANHSKKIELKVAKDVSKSSYLVRNVSRYKGKVKDKISICGIEFDTKRFCFFLGAYLADGSTTNRGNNYDSKIAQMPSKNREYILNKLKGFEIELSNRKDSIGIIGNSEFSKWLYNLGNTFTKRVPSFIKELDRVYLDEFLDAYLHTDGAIQKDRIHTLSNNRVKGSRQLFTSNKSLADDLTEIAIKCGYAPSFSKNKNGNYIITLTTKKLALAKDVIEVDYKGYVRCVELEKYHTLYVRRNGKALFSGNCRCSVIPLTKTQAQKIGIKQGKDYIDKPEYQPDEGWDYNPAMANKPFVEPYKFKKLQGQKTNKDYNIPTNYKTFKSKKYELKEGSYKTKQTLGVITKRGDYVTIHKELKYKYNIDIIKDVLLSPSEIWALLGENEFNNPTYLIHYVVAIKDKKGKEVMLLVTVDNRGQVLSIEEIKNKIREGIPLLTPLQIDLEEQK